MPAMISTNPITENVSLKLQLSREDIHHLKASLVMNDHEVESHPEDHCRRSVTRRGPPQARCDDDTRDGLSGRGAVTNSRRAFMPQPNMESWRDAPASPPYAVIG